MKAEAISIIEKLGLIPHPEGGFFKEIYRSDELILENSLPPGYKTGRNFSTSIYYFLTENQISAFHRLRSDEVWHYYKGSPVIIHCLDENKYFKVKLGNQIDQDENPQFVIRAGIWFAAEIEDKNYYSLIGCTVAPGFDFTDFELADRNCLIEVYPAHSAIIEKFTKEK